MPENLLKIKEIIQSDKNFKIYTLLMLEDTRARITFMKRTRNYKKMISAEYKG